MAHVYPRVGVSAIVYNASGQILMGLRKGSHGAGKYSTPGGHLELSEAFTTCAQREILEETGLETTNHRVVPAVTNDIMDHDGVVKHYVTVYVACERVDASQEAEVKEPEKCEKWVWMSWDEIRLWASKQDSTDEEWRDKKLFMPVLNLVGGYSEIEKLL